MFNQHSAATNVEVVTLVFEHFSRISMKKEFHMPTDSTKAASTSEETLSLADVYADMGKGQHVDPADLTFAPDTETLFALLNADQNDTAH